MRSYIRYSHKWGSHTIKNKFDVLFAGLILSLFLFVGLSLQSAEAADVTVCPSGCDQTSIQDAINVANDGDVITVAAGTYTGNNINVNKQVTISGAPGAIVEVPNVTQTNGFEVHANNVTIEGFEIVGPADSSYLTYAWGGTVTRGIFVFNGITNFNITNNTIKNLRNNILIDGRNTGSVTNNVIDNSKSGISVQYTDAGTGNSEGYTINISGNSEGTYGNEWGLNMHLNGHDEGGILVGNAVKIAPNAPDTVQTALLANKAANGGWTVQDQGYSTSNRTDVTVASTGSDANQGSPLGPIATIQTGVNAVVANGTVNIKNGAYNGGINIDKDGVKLEGESQAGVVVAQSTATPFGQGISANAVSDVSINNITFNAPVGSPISYSLQSYQSSGLNLSNLTFNGPGKSTTPKFGGVDINSSQNVSINNVTAKDYSKNGFSFTSKYTSGDTATSGVSLSNITADNNNWAGVAFYTVGNDHSPSSIGGTSDITGVTFSGSNTLSNNAKGLEIVGDSDANVGAHNAPQWGITDGSGNPVDLGNTAFSSNTVDIINYQINDLTAFSASFNGETGAQMTPAERTTLKQNKIVDSEQLASLGTVNIFDADSYVNDPGQSNFMAASKYIRVHNSGDLAAQALVPKDAENVRFTFTQTDGSNVYTDVAGTEHIQSGQYPKPSTGQHQYRVGVSAEAGKYNVTAEYQVGSNWFPVTGNATTYVLAVPSATYVIPSAPNSYFRPSDNPLRVKVDDKYDSLLKVVFNVNSTNFTVNRAQCDLRQAGNYVICDVKQSSSWTNLPEGTYTGKASIYNQANGRLDNLTSPSFTVDATPPQITNFQITDVHSVYGASISVSADVTDSNGVKNVKFYITAPRVSDGACDGNGTQLTSAEDTTASGNTYAATLNTSSLDGDYCINAIAEDNAGSHSSILRIKATFDNTAPDAPTLVSPANNSVVNASAPIANDWNDVADADHYTYQSYNVNGSGNCNLSSIRSTSDYTASQTNSRTIADGLTFCWRVKAVDSAGNQSAWSDLWKVTIDNSAPDAAITAPSNDDFVSGTVTISGTVTDANPHHYYLVIKDSTNSVVGGPGTVNSASVNDYSWDTTGLADGEYTIDLEARDAANNKDAGSVAQISVTVDNTGPDAPTPSLPAGDYTGSQGVELSSADSGSGLDEIYYTTDGSTPDSSSTLYGSAISITADTTLKAIAYDNQGNASSVLTAAYGIAPVISGEGSLSVTTTTIILEWTTDHPATSRVLYDTVSHPALGSAPDYGYAFSTDEDSDKVTSHQVTVTGLTPGTTYYFRTVSHGSPESVSDEIVAITKVGSTSSGGSGSSSGSSSDDDDDDGGIPIFRIFSTTNNAPVGQTNNPNGTGQVLSSNDDDDTGNAEDNNDDGEVQAAASGVSSASTDNKGSNFNWAWIVLALLVLALIYDQYRRHQNRKENN